MQFLDGVYVLYCFGMLKTGFGNHFGWILDEESDFSGLGLKIWVITLGRDAFALELEELRLS